MSGKPLRERDSFPGRQAINQHLHRHHGGIDRSIVRGTVEERLQAHDDLHWQAHQSGNPLGHTHGPYQEGETVNDIARRMLAEGTAAQQHSE